MLISTRTSRLSARASTTHRIFDGDDVREKVADRVVVVELVVDDDVPCDWDRREFCRGHRTVDLKRSLCDIDAVGLRRCPGICRLDCLDFYGRRLSAGVLTRGVAR